MLVFTTSFMIASLTAALPTRVYANSVCQKPFDSIDKSKAFAILGPEWFSKNGVIDALEELHQIGHNELGHDNLPAELGTFNDSQIARKYRGARRLGLPKDMVRRLIEAEVLGGKKSKNKKKRTRKRPTAEASTPSEADLKAGYSKDTLLLRLTEKLYRMIDASNMERSEIASGVLVEAATFLFTKFQKNYYGLSTTEQNKVLNLLQGDIPPENFAAVDKIIFQNLEYVSELETILAGVNYQRTVNQRYINLVDEFIRSPSVKKAPALTEVVTHVLQNATYFDWFNFLKSTNNLEFGPVQRAIVSILPQITSTLSRTHMNESFLKFVEETNAHQKPAERIIISRTFVAYAAMSRELRDMLEPQKFEIHVAKGDLIADFIFQLAIYKDQNTETSLSKAVSLNLTRDITANQEELILTAFEGLDLDIPALKTILQKSFELQNLNLAFLTLRANQSKEIVDFIADNLDLIQSGLQSSNLALRNDSLNLMEALAHEGMSPASSTETKKNPGLLPILTAKGLLPILKKLDLNSLQENTYRFMVENSSVEDLSTLLARSLEDSHGWSKQRRLNLAEFIKAKISKEPSGRTYDFPETQIDQLVELSKSTNKDLQDTALTLLVMTGLKYDQVISRSLDALEIIERNPLTHARFVGFLNGFSPQKSASLLRIYARSRHFNFLKKELKDRLSDQQRTDLIWFLIEELPNHRIEDGVLDDLFNSDVNRALEDKIIAVHFNEKAIRLAFLMSSAGLVKSKTIVAELKKRRAERKAAKRERYTKGQVKLPKKPSNEVSTSKTAKKAVTLADYLKNITLLSPKKAVFKIDQQLRSSESIHGIEEALIALERIPLQDFIGLPEVQRKSVFNAILTTVGTSTKQDILNRLIDCTDRYLKHLQTTGADAEHFESLTYIYAAYFRKGTGANERIHYLARLHQHSSKLVQDSAFEILADFMDVHYINSKPDIKSRVHIKAVFENFEKTKDPLSRAVLAARLLPFSGFRTKALIEVLRGTDLRSLSDVAKDYIENMISIYSAHKVPDITTESIAEDSDWHIKEVDTDSSLVPKDHLAKFELHYLNQGESEKLISRLLEDTSMRSALVYELENGRIPIDVSQTHDGHDIWSIDYSSGQVRMIEVKSASTFSIKENYVYLTHHEMNTARQTLDEVNETYYVYHVVVPTRVTEGNTIVLTPYKDIDIDPFGSEHILNHEITSKDAKYSLDVLKPFRVDEANDRK